MNNKFTCDICFRKHSTRIIIDIRENGEYDTYIEVCPRCIPPKFDKIIEDLKIKQAKMLR